MLVPSSCCPSLGSKWLLGVSAIVWDTNGGHLKKVTKDRWLFKCHPSLGKEKDLD